MSPQNSQEATTIKTIQNGYPPKYNITKRLQLLPGSFMQNRYRLCIELNIHDDTLIRWMATRKNDQFSIPADQFYKIAAFLNCTPTELLTP
jgi:hypothetical protein